MPGTRSGPRGALARRGRKWALAFGVSGLTLALLLLVPHDLGPASPAAYAAYALPSSVDYQPLDRWGTARIAVIALGTFALLLQVACLLVVLVRRRRAPLEHLRVFVPFLGLWMITVFVTYALSQGRTSSVQLWEAPLDRTLLAALPGMFRAGGYPPLSETAVAVFSVAVFGLAAASLGSAVLSFVFRLPPATSFSTGTISVALAFLLGQGVLSIAFMVLALAGLLIREAVWLACLISLAVGALPLSEEVRRLAVYWPDESKAFRTAPLRWRAVGLLLLGALLLMPLQAWARLSWDAGSSYFASAKLMALTHEFHYTSPSYLSVSGFNAETLQGSLILLAGERSGRLLSYLFGLAFVALTAATARILGLSRRAALLAVIMVVTTTATSELMGDGKIDLFGAAAALGSIAALLSYGKSDRRGFAWVSGFLAGLTLLYRPTYVFFLPVIALFLLYKHETGSGDRPGRAGWLRVLRISIEMICFASIPVLFYFLRNGVLFGTPLVSVPTSTGGGEHMLNVFEIWGQTTALWVIRGVYPIYATFMTSGAALGTLTPLLLAALPILTTSRHPNVPELLKGLTRVVSICLLGWLLVLPFVQEARYVLALWAVIFVWASAVVIDAVQVEPSRRLDRLMPYALALLLLLLLVRGLYGIGVTADRPLGGGPAVCTGIRNCGPIVAINRTASPGARVLVLGPYAAYLRPDLLACSSTVPEIDELRRANQDRPAEFWQSLNDLGFDYVIYNAPYSRDFVQFFDPPIRENPLPIVDVLYDQMIHSGLRIRWPHSAPERRYCVEAQDGKWSVQD